MSGRQNTIPWDGNPFPHHPSPKPGTKMAKYEDAVYAAYEGSSFSETERETDNGAGFHWSIDGDVATKNTLVRAVANYYKNPYAKKVYQSSILWFIRDGKQYIRQFDKAYRGRYLTTLAKRFVKDVLESES